MGEKYQPQRTVPLSDDDVKNIIEYDIARLSVDIDKIQNCKATKTVWTDLDRTEIEGRCKLGKFKEIEFKKTLGELPGNEFKVRVVDLR